MATRRESCEVAGRTGPWAQFRVAWVAIAVALILHPFVLQAAEQHPTIEKGRSHPYFAAKSLDGGAPFVLDMHRDKKVIMLHLAAWDSDSIAQLPAWERFAKENVGSTVIVVGVVHEQHFARAALFAKWKKIGFPTCHDPLNQADARRMGRAVCIDENGIVRLITRDPAEVTERFVAKEFKADRAVVRPPFAETPNYKITGRHANEALRCLEYIEHGDACMFDPEPILIAEGIKAYDKALNDRPDDPAAAFRLGTAYFTRFCGEGREAHDLQKSLDAWSFAAGHDPKNQVFCERLRQFACASDKQVNSCGWIAEAMRETDTKSLTPSPSSIEIAAPIHNFKPGNETPPPPPGIAAHPSSSELDFGVVRAPNPKVRGLVNVVLGLTPRHAGFDKGKPVRIWITSPEDVKLERRLIEDVVSSDGPLFMSVAAQLPEGTDDAVHVLKCIAVIGEGESMTRFDFDVSIPAKLPDLSKS